jgi:dihydrodipicolinate synthase/N-acetylneuraminate lyase
MATAQDWEEVRRIVALAKPLIVAFDDAGEAVTPPDRRVTYAALIMLMTTHAGSSRMPLDDLLADFCKRVRQGVKDNLEKSVN